MLGGTSETPGTDTLATNGDIRGQSDPSGPAGPHRLIPLPRYGRTMAHDFGPAPSGATADKAFLRIDRGAGACAGVALACAPKSIPASAVPEALPSAPRETPGTVEVCHRQAAIALRSPDRSPSFPSAPTLSSRPVRWRGGGLAVARRALVLVPGLAVARAFGRGSLPFPIKTLWNGVRSGAGLLARRRCPC